MYVIRTDKAEVYVIYHCTELYVLCHLRSDDAEIKGKRWILTQGRIAERPDFIFFQRSACLYLTGNIYLILFTSDFKQADSSRDAVFLHCGAYCKTDCLVGS